MKISTISKFVQTYGAEQPIALDNIKELAYSLMERCEDVFTRCSWKSHDYNCCDGFFPVFTEIGFCYAFNSRLYERKFPNSEKTLPKFEKKFIQETDLRWSFKFGVQQTNDSLPVIKNRQTLSLK